MKREERFVGNGNVWIANSRYRGWQVTCSRCGVSKTITSHDGSSVPPHVIIKRYENAGWEIATRSIHDICPGCHRRQRRPAPIVNGHTTPTPPPPVLPVPAYWHNTAEYFQQLAVLTQTTLSALKAQRHNMAGVLVNEMLARLTPEVTAVLIAETTSAPVPPPAPTKPAPAPIVDADYDKWLAELGTTDAE